MLITIEEVMGINKDLLSSSILISPGNFPNQLLENFPAVDVFIAHNSPRGIHECDTSIHQGFDAFIEYIDRAQPAYFLHGHQHCREVSYRGNTCIMGVYGEKNFTLDL